MKEPKNIENLFKESFNGFEAEPGKNSWTNIQSQINAPLPATVNTGVLAASSSKILTAIIAVSIIGLSIGGYFYFDSKGSKQKKQRTLQEKVVKPIINSIQDNKVSSEENSPIINETLVEESSTDEAIVVKKSPQVKNVITSSKSTETTNPIEEKSVEDVLVNPSQKNEIAEESNPISKMEENTSAIETQSDLLSESNVSDNHTLEEASSNNDVIDENQQNTEDNESIAQEAQSGIVINEEIEAPVFEFPTIFSPNSDNMNDVFKIEVEGADKIQVQIFNKSSKLIHQWDGEYGFWDGLNADGTQAPNGVYFYRAIIGKNGKDYPDQGTITLTR